jgi:F-type H+-transporting ATPase subunit gamma
VRQVGFANADAVIGEEGAALFDEPASSTSHAVLLEFRSVISQARRAAAHPGRSPPAGTGRPRRAIYEYEPDEAEILAELLPRNIAVQIFRALLENALRTGRAHERHGQRHAQCRRHDQQADAELQPQRQAMITKELIEIISGAEAL